MTNLESRIRGGMMGLLVGDALGVPYEFHKPTNLPPKHLIEFTPPNEFRRSYPAIRGGTYSADGAQALALLQALLFCDGDKDGFISMLTNNLMQWLVAGEFAVDRRVFDVGEHTKEVLTRLYTSGEGPAESLTSYGNGSLMRVLPLALFFKGSDTDLIGWAMSQSAVTHPGLIPGLSCAFYCLYARYLLTGPNSPHPWHRAKQKLRDIAGASIQANNILDQIESVGGEPGGAYVLDTLRSAIRVFQYGGSFEEVAKNAVALGGDTDTTACVACGLAGIKYGIEGIPRRWIDGLHGSAIYEPLLDQLVLWSCA